MKTLADEGATHSKLIVLGITNAGASFISFGKDLANRTRNYQAGSQIPEDKIYKLITLGETHLNVLVNIRDEIVEAAGGSFYLTQMLCHHALLRAGIVETADVGISTQESFQSVKSQVIKQLQRKPR